MSAPPPPSSITEQALFRPVKSGNTFEQTVERLAQAIKLGVVPKGERILFIFFCMFVNEVYIFYEPGFFNSI